MTTKLHEVLAVDKDKANQAAAIVGETTKLWKKPNVFLGTNKKLEMFDEARQHEAEAVGEILELTTTVGARLEYTHTFINAFLNGLMQKESANQRANADIILDDGKTLAVDIPATMLLALERELGKLRQVYAGIPTLDASIMWRKDPAAGDGVYQAAEPTKSHKTEKTMKVISLAAATPQHKEQVITKDQDAAIGQWITKKWSGMITSATKASMLMRFDDVMSAVKKARMRANETSVITGHDIGERLTSYILGSI